MYTHLLYITPQSWWSKMITYARVADIKISFQLLGDVQRHSIELISATSDYSITTFSMEATTSGAM